MIEVIGLHKEFEGRTVLNDINFTFETGKCNLVIGQSGSGKTVLLKCMVGLFQPDQGQVLYHGRDYHAMPEKDRKEVRKEIGMVFQGGALFDSQTVEENVMFPLTMFSKMSMEERIERVNFCLKRVNLTNVNKLFPAEISGGMKKRVAIARAIALNPKYIFFDEPNSGLDPQTSIVIDDLIAEITHEYGITTVINTHDMNSVMQMGENIIFIYKGKQEWTGNSQSIVESENENLNNFVFASDLFKKMRQSLREKK